MVCTSWPLHSSRPSPRRSAPAKRLMNSVRWDVSGSKDDTVMGWNQTHDGTLTGNAGGPMMSSRMYSERLSAGTSTESQM